ncbi:GNAT family N-acetyltransferase [Hufsiella ginkgonis]|uniref:GNAT family N-acetyltransferase n=1 Tax=Hufsiella ginkgonis TaxID=2695274 RepID=A0A7K1Y1I4_9SPHI|nr:GNAT family N-acetyltransferase [Hufsiella ginkgonis]MXV17062.1 GNAT family N-acetyltransferase [Hufsiella ginkgonis]
MLIRYATLTDIPAIMDLIKQVVPLMRAAGNFQWDDKYPNPEVFAEDITLQQLWVADVAGNIAGVSAVTTQQDAEYAQVGWDLDEEAIVTHRLAVRPGYQGQGIAGALLAKAENEAVRKGISVLRIDTNSENQATNRLFPRMGYTFAGAITLEFRPGLSFYCYEKRL